MPVSVRIPAPLQKLTGGESEIKADGDTLKALLEDLDRAYPGIRDRICDESGKVRRFINVYVNEEDVRFLQLEETPLKDGDEVSIVPAIAGGRR